MRFIGQDLDEEPGDLEFFDLDLEQRDPPSAARDVGFGSVSRSTKQLATTVVATLAVLGLGYAIARRTDRETRPSATTVVAPVESATGSAPAAVSAAAGGPAQFDSTRLEVDGTVPWNAYVRFTSTGTTYRLDLASGRLTDPLRGALGVVTIGETTLVLDDNDLGPLASYVETTGSVWTSWTNVYLRLSFGAGGLRGFVEQAAPVGAFGLPGLPPLAGTTDDGRPVVVAPDQSIFAVESDGSLRRVEGAPGMVAGDYARPECDQTGACFTTLVNRRGERMELDGVAPLVVFSPDGSHAAVTRSSGTVALVDLDTASVVRSEPLVPRIDESRLGGAGGWSPDGAWFATVDVRDTAHFLPINPLSRTVAVDLPSAAVLLGLSR